VIAQEGIESVASNSEYDAYCRTQLAVKRNKLGDEMKQLAAKLYTLDVHLFDTDSWMSHVKEQVTKVEGTHEQWTTPVYKKVAEAKFGSFTFRDLAFVELYLGDWFKGKLLDANGGKDVDGRYRKLCTERKQQPQ